jgi:single-strand DNA-binding protein
MTEHNKVILIGNLTRDPELRYTPGGVAVCEFPIAVHHRYRINDEFKEEVCYIDVVSFGRTGEVSKQHLHKGSRVLVDGRLTQRRWETPEGRKRSKHEVVAHTVQFMDAGVGPASGHEEDLPL